MIKWIKLCAWRPLVELSYLFSPLFIKRKVFKADDSQLYQFPRSTIAVGAIICLEGQPYFLSSAGLVKPFKFQTFISIILEILHIIWRDYFQIDYLKQ